MGGDPDGRVRVGCSGWNYASWRHGVFYPERCPARLWLEHYARHFDTVEVNATFYRLPTVNAVQGWVDRAERLRAWPESYVYFNNDWEGFALRNALRLRELVES